MWIIGCDFHPRYQQVYGVNKKTGEVVERRLSHEGPEAKTFYRELPAGAVVGMEATGAARWFERLMEECGHHLWIGDAARIRASAVRKQKTDTRDARQIYRLLELGEFPRIWVPTPAERDVRQLLLHRHKLVHMASSVKAQVYAVLGKNGIAVTVSDLFGVAGSKQLRTTKLPEVFRARIDSQLRVLGALEAEVDRFDKMIHKQLREDRGYRLIQRIDGVGPVLAAVFVAELGDVSRFVDATRVCSWTGLTPRHRESDTTVHRGSITKQGSRLVQWAAVESVQILPRTTVVGQFRDRIAARRGHNIGVVAALSRDAIDSCQRGGPLQRV